MNDSPKDTIEVTVMLRTLADKQKTADLLIAQVYDSDVFHRKIQFRTFDYSTLFVSF